MRYINKIKKDSLSYLLGIYLSLTILSYFNDKRVGSTLNDLLTIGYIGLTIVLAVITIVGIVYIITNKVKPKFSLLRVSLIAVVLFVPFYSPACCAMPSTYRNTYGLVYESDPYRIASKRVSSIYIEKDAVYFALPLSLLYISAFLISSEYLNLRREKK